MPVEFYFPQRYQLRSRRGEKDREIHPDVKSLLVLLERNSRDLEGWINDKVLRQEASGIVDLPAGSTIGGTAIPTGSHGADHERAGSDEIDGDHLEIDLTPSNYTPSTSPAEADHVDDLAAHLAGIDDALLHTIASHSDTTATGAELEELTDGSETTLHSHAGGGGGSATSFTPTWQGTGSDPDWGSSGETVQGYWWQEGNTVHWVQYIDVGSGDSAGSGDYFWNPTDDSLPTPDATVYAFDMGGGGWRMRDSGSNDSHVGVMIWQQQGGSPVYMVGINDTTDDLWDSGDPIAFATGDEFHMHGWYLTSD